MTFGNVWAVFFFEWRRALTIPRLAWWMVLTLWPVAIVMMILVSARRTIPSEPWTVFLFVLIPMATSMLGTFLWTTPAVSSELERESWIYLAVRPGGKTAVLLGKYLAAVTWVLPPALLALTLAVLIARPEDAQRVWSTNARITCLSVPTYAAVYLVLGTLFSRRSLVIAVAYTLIFELGVSMVPAVINKLTVQYRLRALLVDWAGFQIDAGVEGFETISKLLGDAPAWWHVVVLIGYTAACLAAAVLLVRSREYLVGRASEA